MSKPYRSSYKVGGSSKRVSLGGSPSSKFSKSRKQQQLSFQMVNEDFYLITGPYNTLNETRKEVIKRLGGQWDQVKKCWKCHMSSYSTMKDQLERTSAYIDGISQLALNAMVPIGDRLVFEQQCIAYHPEDRNKILEEQIPHSIAKNLFSFQKVGIQFGLQNNGRVLIADEMGVGKTIQAICLAACYPTSWPLLIICPSSLKYNWKDEVLKWSPDLKDAQVQILRKASEPIFLTSRVLICSYDMVSRLESDRLRQFRCKIAIADEAHYLKNSLAKRTISLVPFLQRLKHVILLTGTPAFARPQEMFTLLQIIRPDIFTSFRSFGDRYCDPKLSSYGKAGLDYSGSSNEKELHYLLKKNIMIRRLKSEVLSQLPKKIRKKVIVNVDPAIIREIQSILSQSSKSSLEQLFDQIHSRELVSSAVDTAADFGGGGGESTSIFAALSLCYRLSGLAKLDELKNYIKSLLDNDIKLIVFAHHQDMLNELETFVEVNLKLTSIRIDGKVDSQERHARVQRFQTDSQVRVAILSLAAASVGLTLTASSNIVFAEMHWTPAIMLQAEDRAHRIGQESSVLCHYVVGEKTLDDVLYKKIEQKIAVVSHILDGQKRNLHMDTVQDANGDIVDQPPPIDYNSSKPLSLGGKKLSDDIEEIDEKQSASSPAKPVIVIAEEEGELDDASDGESEFLLKMISQAQSVKLDQQQQQQQQHHLQQHQQPQASVSPFPKHNEQQSISLLAENNKISNQISKYSIYQLTDQHDFKAAAVPVNSSKSSSRKSSEEMSLSSQTTKQLRQRSFFDYLKLPSSKASASTSITSSNFQQYPKDMQIINELSQQEAAMDSEKCAPESVSQKPPSTSKTVSVSGKKKSLLHSIPLSVEQLQLERHESSEYRAGIISTPVEKNLNQVSQEQLMEDVPQEYRKERREAIVSPCMISSNSNSMHKISSEVKRAQTLKSGFDFLDLAMNDDDINEEESIAIISKNIHLNSATNHHHYQQQKPFKLSPNHPLLMVKEQHSSSLHSSPDKATMLIKATIPLSFPAAPYFKSPSCSNEQEAVAAAHRIMSIQSSSPQSSSRESDGFFLSFAQDRHQSLPPLPLHQKIFQKDSEPNELMQSSLTAPKILQSSKKQDNLGQRSTSKKNVKSPAKRKSSGSSFDHLKNHLDYCLVSPPRRPTPTTNMSSSKKKVTQRKQQGICKVTFPNGDVLYVSDEGGEDLSDNPRGRKKKTTPKDCSSSSNKKDDNPKSNLLIDLNVFEQQWSFKGKRTFADEEEGAGQPISTASKDYRLSSGKKLKFS